MKRILFILFLISGLIARGQNTYRPSNTGYFTPSNKPFSPATPIPTDGRTYKADTVNGLFRPYAGTSEVLSYLPTGSQYRVGQFPIVVNIGGSLQSNGSFIGGEITVWWFLKGQADSNLVRMDSTASGTCTTCLLKANNLSDVQSLITTLINLNLNNVDNTSDATKNAATVVITNHTIDANNNTLLHIPNSALTNNSIGLTVTNTGTNPGVITTPAALGASLVYNVPFANGTNTGYIRNTDWTLFDLKVDSTTESNDTVYDWHNGSASFRYVIPAGTGAVLSVTNVDGTITFSPTTGNVVGSVNQGANFTWTGTNTFTGAPTFSSLTTNGGVFYGNGSGTLQQSPVGTNGQIFESQGASGPIFFTPNAATVNGWLGYTPLSNALGSTHIFVGNGSNIATDVAATGDWTINNTGVNVIGNNKVTYAKIQAAAGQGLMGATGAGNFGLITLGTNLSMSGSVLNATGGGSLSLTTHPSSGASNAPTLISSVLNIDTLAYGKIFRPEQFGGKGDGKRILDVATNNGSNIITSATANFTSGDIGKWIRISGTGGVDLFAQITGFTSSTQVTLSANATSTASNQMGIYGTDNTPATQQCIYADSVAGGGTIYFGSGIYVFAGPLNTTAYGVITNSQLVFPISGLGFGRTPFLTRMHYVFKGETPPNFAPLFFADSLPSLKGTVLYDIIDGSGALPALFGTKTPTGTINNLSYNYFTFKDLTILVPQNIGNGGPSIGGINMYYGAGLITDNVLVCTDQSIGVSVQPIHVVAGIVYPQFGAEIQTSAKFTQVECFQYGIIAFDDFLGENIFTMACAHGLVLPGNAENVQVNSYKSYWNQNNVYFPNSNIAYIPAGIAYFNITNMMSEVVTSVGPWYAYTNVVEDTSDLARGNINYTMVASGGSFNNALYNQYKGDSIQAYAIGSPAIHPGIAQVLSFGNTDVTLGPSGPNMSIGNTNWQALTNNNFALSNNMSFNGSTWVYGVNGAASNIQLDNGSILGRYAVSGTGGGGASVLTSLSINPDKSGGIGGAGVAAGSSGYWLNWNTTGAFNLSAYGAGTNTGTPTFSLQTTSSGGLIEGPLVASGNWTPTVTTGTNVSAGSGNVSTYSRVGNIVSFAGSVNATITLAATGSVVNISLPVSSTFTAVTDANGTIGSNSALSLNPQNLIANTSSGNTMIINFGSGTSTGGYVLYFSGQYLVH